MFRDGIEIGPKENFTFYFDSGGLGDLIASLPVVQYAINNFTHTHIIFWVPNFCYDLVNASLTGNYTLRNLKDYKQGEKVPGKAISPIAPYMLAVHLTDLASIAYLDTTLKAKDKNYLSVNTENISLEKFSLPEKFVAIPVAFTTDVREFKASKINEIVNYIKTKGYEVVFLGKTVDRKNNDSICGRTNSDINLFKGTNLINKTTLLESVAIMKQSAVVLGLDNGLLHLAGMTKKPIIFGFTTVNPEHRLPYRHNEQGWNCYSVVPPESLKCRGCQSNWNLVFNNNFTTCFYKRNGFDSKIQCVEQLPVEEFIKCLEKILIQN